MRYKPVLHIEQVQLINSTLTSESDVSPLQEQYRRYSTFIESNECEFEEGVNQQSLTAITAVTTAQP
jgi:hypothetical protein